MIRALIGLLIAAIAAAFIRGVIQMITREVGQMVNPDSNKANPNAAGPNTANAAGPSGTATPLRKCAVCGTYTPGDRMIQGKYCSEACATRSQ